MKKKYFLKNQSSLQRQIVAGGLVAAFAFGTVGSGFAGAMNEEYILKSIGSDDILLHVPPKDKTKCSKWLTGLVVGVLVIIAIIVVVVLVLRSKSTTKPSKEVTEPGNEGNEKGQKGGEKQEDKKKGNEQQQEQEVEQGSSKSLDSAEVVGRTLLGSGIGIAATALIGEKSNGTAMAGGEKVEASGENGAIEAVTPQGDDIPDGLQDPGKTVEAIGEEKTETQNASEDANLGANSIEKIEGESEEARGENISDGL